MSGAHFSVNLMLLSTTLLFQESQQLGGHARSCLFGLEDVKLQSTFATSGWFH